jgi:hypothetical protein
MNKCSTRREGPTSLKMIEMNNGHKSEGEKIPHL